MKLRGRPKKYRIVQKTPKIRQFSPRGKPGRPDETIMTIEEFEAMRLADYQALEQKSAARSMRVSQETFSRILKKARKKVADGIVNGKIIRIEGGCYQLDLKSFPKNFQESTESFI